MKKNYVYPSSGIKESFVAFLVPEGEEEYVGCDDSGNEYPLKRAVVRLDKNYRGPSSINGWAVQIRLNRDGYLFDVPYGDDVCDRHGVNRLAPERCNDLA